MTSIARQKPHESYAAGSGANQGLDGGLMMHNGCSARGQIMSNPIEQVPKPTSNHIFPNTAPRDLSNMSQILPSFTSSR